MNRLKLVILLQLFVFSFSTCKENEVKIFVNQIGYLPKQVKYAVVIGEIDSFKVVSTETNKVEYSGKLSQPKYWALSDEVVRIADFTKVKKKGTYKIIAKGDSSYSFEISNDVYKNISKASLKAFYYQRASTELPEKFAGKWKRKCGLSDTTVYIHSSAASIERPEGSIISAPGGWFDAGDYNKYIVNSGITTYTLILLYDLFPEYIKTVSLNIPESNNDIPDILDEILWNVRWMMKMQDPEDGGVYHKLTCKNFQPYLMPSEVKAKRFVVGKSTAAALDFSAVLSHLSVSLKKHNNKLKSLSDSCLTMAKKAWQWAVKNPNKHFKNPPDIQTGEYSDNKLKDNFFWAGIELYLATNDTSYLRYVDNLDEMVVDSLYWAHVANLGILSTLTNNTNEKKYLTARSKIRETFEKNITILYNKNQQSPYRISLGVFKWGSNSNLLNETLMLLAAYKIYGDKKYLTAAITNTDYILGRNPLNICYVTGFGSKSPLNIHHRISIADGMKEPIPGLVVGGANPYYLIDCGKDKYPSLLPAKCYLDDVDSYSTNEIAINWNAALVFVLFSIDNFSQK